MGRVDILTMPGFVNFTFRPEKSIYLLIAVVHAGIVLLTVIMMFPIICAPSTTGNRFMPL